MDFELGGATMFGIGKQPAKTCGDCLNIKTGTAYGKPVCYELQKINGQPAATVVSLTDRRAKDCGSFRGGRLNVTPPKLPTTGRR